MNAGAPWRLHPRLEADTHFIARWNLCDLRLMDDARFPWLILVPRLTDAVELVDLDGDTQTRLLDEINRASRVLRLSVCPEKLNIGALGNIVRPLHVHIVGRNAGDAAWPGPVWGCGVAERYATDAMAERIHSLLAACGST